MSDPYFVHKLNLVSPARKTEVADFSSDDHEFEQVPRSIYVNAGSSGGNVTCRIADDSADVAFQVDVSTVLPVRPTHIRNSGTTVAGVIGLL